MNDLQVELLRELAAVVAGMPEDHLKLNAVHAHMDCGTVCCALGAAALHPRLAPALGLELIPGIGYAVKIHGVRTVYAEAGAKLFGLTMYEAKELFGPVPLLFHVPSHKQVFARRLVNLFDRHKLPVNPVYREQEAALGA